MKRFLRAGKWGLVVLLVLGTAVAVVPRASAGAGYSAVVLADTPLGYWRLGESDASQPAKDASGNGYDGTYNGGVTVGQPGAINGDADTAVRSEERRVGKEVTERAGG